MEVNRYKMAEYGVGALALNGSKKAVRNSAVLAVKEVRWMQNLSVLLSNTL